VLGSGRSVVAVVDVTVVLVVLVVVVVVVAAVVVVVVVVALAQPHAPPLSWHVPPPPEEAVHDSPTRHGPVQTPAWHTSGPVQPVPSLHAVPSGRD